MENNHTENGSDITASTASTVQDVVFVKHSFFDSETYIGVQLFVKDVQPDSVQLCCTPKSFSVTFRTSDKNFLHSNGNASPDTIFRYALPSLRGLIDPNESSPKVTPAKIELRLFKSVAMKWPTLTKPDDADEAPSAPLKSSPSSPPVSNASTPQTSSLSFGSQRLSNGSSATSADRFRPTISPNGSPSLRKGSSCDGRTAMPSGSTVTATGDAVDRLSPVSTSNAASVGRNVRLDMTSKLSHSNGSCTVVPGGRRGLINRSNNCYQNSVIQVLANTPHLRQFCLNEFTMNDINRSNPLGSKGRTAVELVRIIRELWRPDLSLPPVDTASSIGDIAATRFRPYFQHDAQEFIAFLLDSAHEDLNKGCAVPGGVPPAALDPPLTDQASSISAAHQARAAWDSFLRKNSSPLVDLFYGQIRTKITCQHCSKDSLAFDPFMMLPLPLAKPSKPIALTALYFPQYSPSDPPIFLNLTIPSCLTAEEVKQLIKCHLRNRNFASCDLKLFAYSQLSQIGLVEVWRVSESIELQQRNTGEGQSACLMVYEVAQGSSGKLVQVVQHLSVQEIPFKECAKCNRKGTQAELQRCSGCQMVAYCGSKCQKDHWKAHRPHCKTFEQIVSYPLCLQISPKCTYEKFVKMVSKSVLNLLVHITCEKHHSHSFSDHVRLVLITDDKDSTAASGSTAAASSKTLIEQDITPSNFSSLILQSSSALTRLRLKWLNGRAGSCKLQVTAAEINGATVEINGMPELTGYNPDRTSLMDCLRVYFEPELLHSTNAWHCPSCKKPRVATQASLISRCPRYLLVYLKRFSQDHYLHKDKTPVSYPSVLDLTQFVDKASCEEEEEDGAANSGTAKTSEVEPTLYYLYGVVCHYGTMQFGHYASFARLPAADSAEASQLGWRSFDDEDVSDSTPARAVDLSDAYILFYQRADPVVEMPVEAPDNNFAVESSGDEADNRADSPESNNRKRSSSESNSQSSPHSASPEAAQLQEDSEENGDVSTDSFQKPKMVKAELDSNGRPVVINTYDDDQVD